MNETRAYALIHEYIEGWKTLNKNKITQPLARDCVIRESHGSTYRGVASVKDWIRNWISDGNIVKRWDITSFLFIKNTAVFEWIFEFSSAKTGKHTIEGITIARFSKNKITYLREYRTTKPKNPHP